MITFSQWQFNPENGELSSVTATHRLPPRLVKLLIILTENAPHLVEKQTLIAEIWQDKIVNDDALARSIAELRGFLGDSSKSPEFIETVPRRGYRFMQEVGGSENEKDHFTSKYLTPIVAAFCVGFVLFWFDHFTHSQQAETANWQEIVDNVIRLNADLEMEYQPEISPSGQRVAFGVKAGQDVIVKIVDTSGKDLVRIAEPGAWVLSPAWSPDENNIAVSIADSQQCNIYVVTLPELTRERLSHCSIPNGSGILDWSPDGSKIAFVGRLQEGNRQPSVLIYELDTGTVSRITTPSSDDVFDTRPRFDKDGDSLYFLRGTTSVRNIHRTAISDNSHVERLTSSNNLKLSFALSLVNHDIVFDSNANGDRNLWLLSQDDLAIKNLGARDSQFPSISKNGQLLYQEVRYQANLWRFDLESTLSRQIVNSPKYDNHPAISPDSDLIAYVSNRFGRAEIWLYDPENGQDNRLLARENEDLLAPVWSANGEKVLLSSRGDNGYGCYEIHIETRKISRIHGHGRQVFACQYLGNDRILAINKTEDSVSHLMEIRSEGVTQLTTDAVNKAMPLSNGDIVYSRTSEPGLHVLQFAGDGTPSFHAETVIADFPNHKTGHWTAAGEVVYFLNPVNPRELRALNLHNNEQSVLLTGLDVGVGDAIAIAPNKQFAVISQKGTSQSNLFISRESQ